MEPVISNHRFIQQEQLAEHIFKSKPVLFTTKGLANMFGLTPRRARQIIAKNHVAFIKEGGKRYYCINPLLDLLSGYSFQLDVYVRYSFTAQQQSITWFLLPYFEGIAPVALNIYNRVGSTVR